MHAWQGHVVRIRCCDVQRGGTRRLVSTEEARGTEEGSANLNGTETLRRSGNVGKLDAGSRQGRDVPEQGANSAPAPAFRATGLRRCCVKVA